MISLSSFIEIYISIHILLAVGSLFAGRFLLQSSSKLTLARILFVGCILSPLAVKLVKPADRPPLAKFMNFDEMQKQIKASVVTADQVPISNETASIVSSVVEAIDYSFWATLLFMALASFRSIRFMGDLVKVRNILCNSQILRKCRRLQISVSDQCLVPFSVNWFGKSHVVLPVSMMSSAEYMRIAIAHEGQHHRQGDCSFAYVLECVSILFFGNPGVARWRNVFTELQEFSCDEALVGRQVVTPHVYGRCLLKVAQIASQGLESSRREFACAVGMAQNCGNSQTSILKRRIVMLSKYQSPRPTRKFFRSALAFSFVSAPLCTAYAAHGTLTNMSPDSLEASSLDPRIQKIAEQEIDDAVTRYKARSGAVVIADPKSGRILAFAERLTDERSESWKSRIFVPASTIKPFVVAAAIQAGVATESKSYDCRGPYDVDGTKFTNHDKNFGDMTLTEAVAKSGNVCMIKIGQETGSARMRKALARFGFDTDSQWRPDSSDALQLATIVALGEGVPVTFNTMIKAYSILANKGYLPNHEGAISEATAASVQRTMIAAVEQGIAKKAAIPGVSVAGKTGTLVESNNVRTESNVEISRHLGLFAGYAPANNPKFVSFVIIEDGHRPNENHEKAGGGVLAAPVFREVVRKSLELNRE